MGWMFLVPIALYILLSVAVYKALQAPMEDLMNAVSATLEIPVDPTVEEGWDGFVNSAKGALNATRDFLLTWILRLGIAYLLFLVNKYIVLILLAPLMAYASERAEEIITGQHVPFRWVQLLRDALRGALLAARNGVLEAVITLVIWVLTLLIPLLAPLAVVLLFLVSSYFYGFSMFDYILERRRATVRESVRGINQRMGMVVANGALFSLLMKVPLLGIMTAPLMGSVGAVLAEVRHKEGTSVQRVP